MISSGPRHSPLMILGEAPGWNEVQQGLPFVGASGWETNKMLNEVGFNRDSFFVTNVCHERPPDDDINAFFASSKTKAQEEGLREVEGRYPRGPILKGMEELRNLFSSYRPKLIIAQGNTALWALTGLSGIGKWRGSEIDDCKYCEILVPTWHTAAILREWALRPEGNRDLTRAARDYRQGRVIRPAWRFHVRPHFKEVMEFLDVAEECHRKGDPLTFDGEMRGGHMACFGVAISKLEALCIPFMCIERPEGYWSLNEELAIVQRLKDITTSDGGPIIFQNALWDMQYTTVDWGFAPRTTDDTMVMQHVLFPGLRKALDYLSSLYCDYHRYWKDDGKLWDPSIPEDQLWSYNCEDCVRTFEVFEVLKASIDAMGMREQYRFQIQVLQAAFKMVVRGIKVDLERKKRVMLELDAELENRDRWFHQLLDKPFNPRSNKQCAHLFYEEIGCAPIFPRAKKRGKASKSPTVNDDALKTIGRKYPLLHFFTTAIEEYRSIGTFKGNFADMELSPDGRARCSINLTGTETFRWSTSEDAFGSGTNLQTIPKGTEDD
jgi:uracil-DNA glycosylase